MLVDGPAEYRPRFKTFVQLAKHGTALETAFTQAFTDLTPRQFDNDFRLYLAKREIGVWRAPYVRPTTVLAPKERYLTDAEVHVLRAQLTPWQGPRAALAERDLQAARRAAPTWPDATYYRGLFSLAQGDPKGAERYFQSALTMSPGEEPRFLLGLLILRLAQNETGPKDDTALLSVALRLAAVARTAVQLNDSAEALRRLSRPEDALLLLGRALKLAPFDSNTLDTMANVLFDLGRAAEAVEFQTRAISFLDERRKDRRGFEERLARYKQAAELAQ
jgi:tetratricopeptide (TPR) repeat protein